MRIKKMSTASYFMKFSLLWFLFFTVYVGLGAVFPSVIGTDSVAGIARRCVYMVTAFYLWNAFKIRGR